MPFEVNKRGVLVLGLRTLRPRIIDDAPVTIVSRCLYMMSQTLVAALRLGMGYIFDGSEIIVLLANV